MSSMNPDFAVMIDCYKIVTWLDQRKKLDKNWQTFQKAAQAKIRLLLDDTNMRKEVPPAVDTYIQKHADNFTYSDVLWVCTELQKSPLANARSILNQYTNQTLKSWLALKKFMQGKLVGVLAEAKLINQVLKFEIPGLKKTCDNLRDQIGLLKRKIDSNKLNISSQQEQYITECKSLGVKGQHIHLEIPQLVEQLPAIFTKFENLFVTSVAPVLKAYRSFCEVNQSHPPPFLITEYFIKNGDDIKKIYTGQLTEGLEQLRKKKYDQFVVKKSNQEWDIQVADAAQTQTSLDTLLYDRQTRQQILCQLNELLYFLLARKSQSSMKTSGTAILDSAYSKVDIPEENLQEGIKNIGELVSLLVCNKTTQLLNLMISPKTYERILKRLQLYGVNVKRCEQNIEKYGQNIEGLEAALKSNMERIDYYKEKLEKAKNVVEQELTVFLKREAKVIGDINKL